MKPWIIALLATVAAAAGVTVGILSGYLVTDKDRGAADRSPSSPPPSTQVGDCPDATATVRSAIELHAALGEASPGDVIVLEPGAYQGEFTASAEGTADEPITLCGPRDAELVGAGPEPDGYGLHLDGAAHWNVSGFTVRESQKGVMVDGGEHNVIEGLDVHHIGDEGIHLRAHSTDNVVRGNEIHDTGLRKEKYGEGIYVGSAESNWCDITDCEPDRSDRNVLEGNTIYATTAESVDIKEGTSDGVLRNNEFDGADITEEGGDSWVDVKGNAWLIEGNRGQNAPLDGFQTHEILDGWGTDNVFRNNTAEVDSKGYGFSLTPVRDNIVACSNTASGAGEGLATVECSNA